MSNLLRNDHNVYILGAGFSREAGLPLISDFLSQMRDSYDWLVQQNREQEAKAVDKVLKFRLAAASAAYWVNLDLENIEELFSLAFANTDGIAESMRFAIAATLDYARKTKGSLRTRLQVRHDGTLFKNDKWPDWIKQSDQQPTDNSGFYEIGSYALHVARLMGMLKDGKPQGENTFITFNYDTLLEEALTELNLSITYGSRIESPFTPNAKSRAEPTPVYKLHGSMNWTRTGAESKAIKAFEHYFQVVTPQLLPELVPPTWKKIFENEIETIWEEAVEKLTTATRIIIIGFSMPPTDMHFKYLLAAGLKKNISLRQILFVNPDTNDELKPRVETMLRQAYVKSGRIDFVKESLGQFVAFHQWNHIGLHQLGRATEYGLTYNVFNQM
jgi:SIR2-like domain